MNDISTIQDFSIKIKYKINYLLQLQMVEYDPMSLQSSDRIVCRYYFKSEKRYIIAFEI